VKRTLLLAVSAAATLASPGRAQQASTGPSFLIFRYASRSSIAMYSGYSTGPLLMVVGMLNNPRTEYREIMGGVGHAVAFSRESGVTVATALGYTDTGWYGQLYLLPTVRAGALTVSGTMELAQPMSTRGTRGFYVSPGNAFVALGHGFSAGGAFYGSWEAGSPASVGAGPALQRSVPHGSLTMELVKGLKAASDEVRFTVRSSF
jgi:hypothetical protein